jgi:hypothetical protein
MGVERINLAPVAGSSEHSNEASCSIKGSNFLDQPSDGLRISVSQGLCSMKFVSY